MTGEGIVLPPAIDQPPLNQSDYMVGDLVNTVPVGGRLSLFVDQWVKITQDHFIISVVRQGFLISVQNNFPGGVTGSHRTPQGSKSSFSHLQGDPRVDKKKTLSSK